MKYLYLIFLLISNLFSAQIDIKLYEGENKNNYINLIKKQIENSISQKTKDDKLTKEELSELTKLQELTQLTITLAPFNTQKLKTTTVSIDSYYNSIKELSIIKYKIDKNLKERITLQSKILSLKESIQKISDNNMSRLLLYQLQFASYKIEQKNQNKKISLLEERATIISELLYQSIPNLNLLDIDIYLTNISTYKQKIFDKYEEIALQKEKKEEAILEENKLIETTNKRIDILQNQLQNLLSDNISHNIVYAISLLKVKDDRNFYNITNETQSLITKLKNDPQKALFLLELKVLKEIFKLEIGQSKFLLSATLAETYKVFENAQDLILSSLFIFNEHSISLYSLFKAFFYTVLGFLLGTLYKRWIAKITTKCNDISMMSVRLVSNIGYYLIVLIFIIISISSLGIDLTSLSLIAGALSIGIGFGLQTLVSNLIAGIILMFERTIRIGDIIEIDNTLTGVVTDMRIRSTTVKTFDNIDVVVPNSSFVQNNVTNMTLEDRVIRLHVPFSVAYGTEIIDVKNAIISALHKSDLFYIKNDEEKPIDIRMVLMNRSSVDLELTIWVHRDMKLKAISIQSDFLILIYDALRANNISIPYHQLNVHMKDILSQTNIQEDK